MTTTTPTRGRGPMHTIIGLVALAGANLTYLFLGSRYLNTSEPTSLAALVAGLLPLTALFAAVWVCGERALPSPSPPGSRTPPEGPHYLPVAAPITNTCITADVLTGLTLGTTTATASVNDNKTNTLVDLGQQLALVRS